MRNIIQFSIEKGLDGYYVAVAKDFAIITQGKTIQELEHNIIEATQLHFEDADEENQFNPTPSVFINYELPIALHVK